MDNDCLVNIFKLLGSPFRQRIIKELRKRPLFVSELEKILNKSQPAVSHQLAELEAAGIIQRGEEPQRRHYYSLCPDTLAALVLEASRDVAPEAIKEARKRQRHTA